jgi:hypothetical protein
MPDCAACSTRSTIDVALTGENMRGCQKLFPAKFARIKSRQVALQTTFSVFLDIFYPSNVDYFEGNGLFQPTAGQALRTPSMRY